MDLSWFGTVPYLNCMSPYGKIKNTSRSVLVNSILCGELIRSYNLLFTHHTSSKNIVQLCWKIVNYVFIDTRILQSKNQSERNVHLFYHYMRSNFVLSLLFNRYIFLVIDTKAYYYQKKVIFFYYNILSNYFLALKY